MAQLRYQTATEVHMRQDEADDLTAATMRRIHEQIQAQAKVERQVSLTLNPIYHYDPNANFDAEQQAYYAQLSDDYGTIHQANYDQPQAERTTGMNNSLAIFLISDAARAIKVLYDPDEKKERGLWTFKTLDPSIKVDDYVVVETDTRHKMTVVKVAEVDVDVDYDSSINYKWIIGRVALEDFDKLKLDEAAALKSINSAEKTKRRDELREAMLKNAEGDLKALPFYTPPAPTVKEE